MGGISSLKKATENPYLKEIHNINLKRKGVMVGSVDKILYDDKTGEEHNLKAYVRYQEVDQEKFVKIFVNKFSNLMDLTRTGIGGLQYVMSQMKENSDEVYVHTTDMCEFCDWAHKTQCYRALNELADKKIIYPSTRPNIYFINPAIMFNGSRLTFIDQYRLKKKGQKDIEHKELPANISFDEQGDYVKAKQI